MKPVINTVKIVDCPGEHRPDRRFDSHFSGMGIWNSRIDAIGKCLSTD